MNFFDRIFMFFYFYFTVVFCIKISSKAEIKNGNLNDIINVIRETLNSNEYSRKYGYGPVNKEISLGVYKALQSIAQNDDLECVSRLLCEASAGGQPGYSGKQLQFDKVSLNKLISYLSLNGTNSSPLLVFGRAALLGVSHRGDPYSCIINYPKCPKNQNRLLYYLNNHRGGFFQYFDKKQQNKYDLDQYYANQYRPYYQYQKYQTKYKRNKIVFQNSTDLKESFSKKATNSIYANAHRYSYPVYVAYKKPLVFPEDKNEVINPRILTRTKGLPIRLPNNLYLDSIKSPTVVNNFFPQTKEPTAQVIVSDRLPSGFNFPFKNNYNTKNSFFPESYLI